jgi:CRP/FNR family transcriptional regulator, cyclic AMP receptor protein
MSSNSPTTALCRVLEEDPDLAEVLPPDRRAEAVSRCVAPAVRVPRGRWPISPDTTLPGGIGLLVLEGLIVRRCGIDGRFGAEILGEGDLLQPWRGAEPIGSLSATTGWRVLQATRVAVLDDRAAVRFAAYPELTGALVHRALDRVRNLSINMAIVHHARVNARVHLLLWHLADRWGRVGPEGIALPLSLTHSVLADLVAARRPTVTSALSELAAQDLVRPLRGGWLLRGDRPGELAELDQLGIEAEAA